MVLKLLLPFISLLISLPGISQILITGKVLGAKDKLPIAFTNIGILNSAVGTISELDGSFSINIPTRYSKSKLLLASLGYTRVNLSVDSIKNTGHIVVYLEEMATELNQVTVRGKKSFRKFRLGNDKSEGGSVYADTITAGSAMAVLIENNKGYTGLSYPANVEQTRLRIRMNTFKEFKIRIRLYDVDPGTGMPGKDILNKSIIKTSNLKNGWLTFDLVEHNIVVNGPFYLTFEWIVEKKDRRFLHHQFVDWQKKHPDLVTTEYSVVDGEKIPFTNYNAHFWSGTSFGISVSPEDLDLYKCFYRYSSFGSWNRSSSILTATVVISN